ncbi:RcnB family protein [Sphingomonas beigongshangi]|uniref:RcnB family protein n=1 Tax=Sphingomonas beigongshangi TaxID=2782540 RepID=UPI00193C3BB4|nr:RcnB family protein [Sphingomonas beigongshangi]
MKKLVLTAIAATLVAGPLAATAAEAAPQRQEVTTVRERPNGTTVVTTRTWRTGQRFDRRYAPNYRRVNEYRTYRLRAPARGMYWVRSGRDALLVRPNGTIVEVRPGLFR